MIVGVSLLNYHRWCSRGVIDFTGDAFLHLASEQVCLAWSRTSSPRVKSASSISKNQEEHLNFAEARDPQLPHIASIGEIQTTGWPCCIADSHIFFKIFLTGPASRNQDEGAPGSRKTTPKRHE